MKRCLLILIGVSLMGTMAGQSVYRNLRISLAADHSLADITHSLVQAFPEVGDAGALSLRYVRQSASGMHYCFDQQIAGIPVYRRGALAHVRGGELNSATINLIPNQEQGRIQFGLSEPQIQELLMAKFSPYKVDLSKTWWVENRSLIPAYRAITFSYDDPASLELVIDAQTGEEIHRIVRDAYHSHEADIDTSGRARVFRPNPCTQAGVAYGDLFTDNDDSHDAIFNDFMDTVILRDITWDNGFFRLEGPYVKIEDIAPNTIAPATSVDGDFFFTRDMSGFEDVMVYYHIDTFQRYIQSLGYFDLRNSPLRVDPHGFGNSDNSSFVPNGVNSYIRHGEGGVDDAEDADVIIHEYGHALSESAAPDSRAGLERRGLDEGIGDYFATIYSLAITPNEWDMLFNWDGHNEFWGGRTASSSATYPPAGSASIYVYGEIWNAALMRMRDQIEDTTMDKLVLEQMYYNYSGMTLEDAARTLILIDSVMYGQAYKEIITFEFCRSGILPEALCLPVSRQPNLEPLSHLSISPNPGTGNFQINWSPVQEDLQMILYDMMGRQVKRIMIPAGQTQFELRLALPEGIYLLDLVGEKRRIGRQKIRLLQP